MNNFVQSYKKLFTYSQVPGTQSASSHGLTVQGDHLFSQLRGSPGVQKRSSSSRSCTKSIKSWLKPYYTIISWQLRQQTQLKPQQVLLLVPDGLIERDECIAVYLEAYILTFILVTVAKTIVKAKNVSLFFTRGQRWYRQSHCLVPQP